MNKRFWIICFVIGFALLTLSGLGLSSLKMHRKGLQAERQQEFIDVARQISFDVKQKVDAFLQAEQKRPYTEYQAYYVPETVNQPQQAVAVMQSPLVNAYSNSFANGYFQLEPDGRLTSPHLQETPADDSAERSEYAQYFDNVRQTLLPSLQNGQTLAMHRVEPAEREKKDEWDYDNRALYSSRVSRQSRGRVEADKPSLSRDSDEAGVRTAKDDLKVAQEQEQPAAETLSKTLSKTKGAASRRSVYPISNLEETQQPAQVLTQSRDNYMMNMAGNEAVQSQESMSQAVQSFVSNAASTQQSAPRFRQQPEDSERSKPFQQQPGEWSEMMPGMPMMDTVQQGQQDQDADQRAVDQFGVQADTVQVRIEPFVPVTVADTRGGNGIFAGQVFLLRHVQIENRHLVQGFQLNEDELLSQVTESSRQFLRRGMGYELSKTERPDAAFAAILQFDFGEVVLNLLETEPGYIQARVTRIRNWFYGILAVVWLAVLLAMAALWKNLREQIQLSRKKDDFISAVSHELRTPLTSIRMYTEMLEKDWVKTDDKRRQYYTTMRTESERLTRLIENVLDFSRIQRGKKKYDFAVGDVNACISKIAEIMRPHIERAGFQLIPEFSEIEPFMFDRDAVTQIVINLIDNALKYARSADDKRIFLRTRRSKNRVLIEVEDHGPGIPRSRQKKIFDAFYRCEDESTRQTTGTGLGLALVKRFAEAHHGFVEIAPAKPTGALFRVTLTSTPSK